MKIQEIIAYAICLPCIFPCTCDGQIIIGRTNQFVSVSTAVKVAASLQVGMAQADADKFLESHGISARTVNTNGETLIYSQNIGDSFYREAPYWLNDARTCSLMLGMRQPDGSDKNTDGILERAHIQSNGVNIIANPLDSAPNSTGAVTVDLRGVQTSENLAKYIFKMATNDAKLGQISDGLDNTNLISLDHDSTFVPIREICGTIIEERFGQELGNHFYKTGEKYDVRAICAFQDEHGSVCRYHITIYDKRQYSLMRALLKKKLDLR